MNWITGPVVGGIIGYVTNYIAIKMLFRPIHPVKIGGKTLPFTPGVIPKEKERIAKKVGEVISRELINEQTLKEALLRPEILLQIETSIGNGIEKYKSCETTLEELTQKQIGNERLVYLKCEVEEWITQKLYNKLIHMDIGNLITNKIITLLKESGLSSLLGPMAFVVNDSLLQTLGAKIEPIINKLVEEEAEELIRVKVEEELDLILESNMGSWVQKTEKYEDIIKKVTKSMYEIFVTETLGKLLIKLDIAKIVEKRILEFDNLELERLILEVINNELKVIVWLGALLGAVIGCVMGIL